MDTNNIPVNELQKEAGSLGKLRTAWKALFARKGPTIVPIAERRAIQMQYPKTGTGRRQGARLERQRRRGELDFSASEKCLTAIRARQQ